MHVRPGMDRLIHSKIRLVQIRPPSSARPAHTPADRKLVQPPVRASPDPLSANPLARSGVAGGVWRRSPCPRRAVFATLTMSVGVIRRIRETRGDGRRHRGHEETAAALPVDLLAVTAGKAARRCRRWHLVVTVRGSAESIESRLLAGWLRCRGVLGPWGHACRRRVAMPDGLEELWPRRGRCRSCGRTHVLLPSGLWSRRRYGAAVIMAVLVLAVQAAAAGRAAARPWLGVPGGRGKCRRRRPGRGGRGSARMRRPCGSR